MINLNSEKESDHRPKTPYKPILKHVKVDMAEKFYAKILNQYGNQLGDGFGSTEEEAKKKAHKVADNTLLWASPHWKWRKAKVLCEEWHP